MSDRNTFDRRHLLTAGAAGILGAAAGFLAGRGSGERDSGEATIASQQTDQPALPTYDWALTIQGGYAWWFRKHTGKTNVSLMSLKPDECTCTDRAECPPHSMLLITFANKVEIDSQTTYQPTIDKQILSWVLEGPTRFIKGMPGNGINEKPGTKWDDIKDPYGPELPHESALWEDQVWLPERQKAKADAATKYAAAEFLLTDGKLEVAPPQNDQARGGRWVFKEGENTKRKALTDVLVLSGQSTDLIGIDTKGGKIFLKPKTGKMPLSIRHEVKLHPIPINGGDKLPHYARLFDFVAGKACKDAVIPEYEKRMDLSGYDTPGDLCPPLPLDD